MQPVPTASGTPVVYYAVTYNSDGRVQFQETWSVPASAQPVRVRDVRVAAGAGGNSERAAAARRRTRRWREIGRDRVDRRTWARAP